MSPSPTPTFGDMIIPVVTDERNTAGVRAICLAVMLAVIVFAIIRRR